MMIAALLVFAAMVALDFAYGEYTKAAADRRILAAANWAVVLYGFGAYVAINVIGDNWMVIPAMCGAWVGTFVSVKWGDNLVREIRQFFVGKP